jgi:hypothetical protein
VVESTGRVEPATPWATGQLAAARRSGREQFVILGATRSEARLNLRGCVLPRPDSAPCGGRESREATGIKRRSSPSAEEP